MGKKKKSKKRLAMIARNDAIANRVLYPITHESNPQVRTCGRYGPTNAKYYEEEHALNGESSRSTVQNYSWDYTSPYDEELLYTQNAESNRCPVSNCTWDYTSPYEELNTQNHETSRSHALKRSWDYTSNDFESLENNSHIENSNKRRKWEANESFSIPHYDQQTIPEAEERRCFSPDPENNLNADLHQQFSGPGSSWDEISWTKTHDNEWETRPQPLDKSFKVMIIPKDYPNTLLNLKEVEEIKMAIFGKLEAAPNPLPIINVGVNTNEGALPITCEGQRSLEFIESFNGLIISGNMKLKVVVYKNLPKPIQMMWKSNNMVCRYLPRVLNMLQRLNPELDTSRWKVVETLPRKFSIRRIVYVDGATVKYLKSKGYKIADGLGTSIFTFYNPNTRKKRSSKSKKVTHRETDNEVVNDSKENETPKYEDKREEIVYDRQIPCRTRHSWGELIEVSPEVIDLTEEYSSGEDYDVYTGHSGWTE